MSSQEFQSFATVEEPDLVIGHYVGSVDVGDIRRVADVQRTFCKGKPHVFLMADLHRMDRITPEARRVAVEPVDSTPILAMALVGASFHIRVIGTMLIRGAQILRPESAFPTRFFESQAEARVWLDELRRQLLARA